MLVALSWITVRNALSGVTAEAAPAIGVMAPLYSGTSNAPITTHVEVRLVPGASVGGSPSSVTFAIWRGSGGRVDKLGTWEVLAADIARPVPKICEIFDGSVFVTVESFVGGSSPSFTGTIEARGVNIPGAY